MFKFLRLFFLIVVAFFISNITEAQVWKKQAKSGNSGLTDVAFISKSTGFVLSSGKVLKTTDTGKTWTQILSAYNRFTRISFADSKTGYIIGYDDLVLKTADGGANWSLKRTGNSDDDLLNLFVKDADTAFVIGPDNLDNKDSANYLEYTYNGGNSWSRKNLNTTKLITSLNMLNKNYGMLSTLNPGLFLTANGFSNYSINTSPGIQINDSKIISDSIVVLVGMGGKISRSSNFGINFKNISSPTSENLKSLHFANDSVGMACGDKGTILITRDRGLSWTKMTTNTRLDFTRVFVINPYLAWAVAYSVNGDSLDIFKYEDKSCLSRFVKVPRDTVICDKFTYEAPFVTVGAFKPTWTVDDVQTTMSQKNDSIASIVGTHEGYFIFAYELQSCEEILRDTSRVYLWRNPTINVKDSIYCGAVDDNISFSCFACKFLWNSTDDSYNFKVDKPGKYWVQVTNYCKTITDTFTLSVLPYLKLNLGNDTILCDNQKLILKSALSPGKFLWFDKDTGSGKTISNAGKYYLNFENKCNRLSDTILIKYKKTPGLYLGRDSLYCGVVNHSVSLDSVKNFSDVTWWDGGSQYVKNITLPGKYFATIKNECGTASDTFQLGILGIPKVDLGKDTVYCNNFKHTIALNPKVPEFKILWWDGRDSLTRHFTAPGKYSIKVNNRCGEVLDTLNLDQKAKPIVNLGKDTSLKKPFSIILDAKNTGNTYSWNTGSILQTIIVNDFGKYWVTVKNQCGETSDTIYVLDKAGINVVLKNNFVRVYPNPAAGMLTIENPLGDFELKLFDQTGNLLIKKTSCKDQETMDIRYLGQGIYFLRMECNGKAEVVRILKL